MIGGTAVAARKIGSAAIRDDSIKSRDIRQSTIRSRDVQNDSLKRRDFTSATRESLGGGPAPSDQVMDTLGHLVYVGEGAQQMSHLTYTLEEPVALNELTELTFFQELVHGDGQFGANVILGVDADDDGKYDADDLGWHLAPTQHDPTALGEDTFVEMDAVGADRTRVQAPEVSQWYSPNAAGNGFDHTDGACYSELANMVANCENVRFDPADEVHLIRLVLGGSGSWNDIAFRLTTSIDGELEPGVRNAG